MHARECLIVSHLTKYVSLWWNCLSKTIDCTTQRNILWYFLSSGYIFGQIKNFFVFFCVLKSHDADFVKIFWINSTTRKVWKKKKRTTKSRIYYRRQNKKCNWSCTKSWRENEISHDSAPHNKINESFEKHSCNFDACRNHWILFWTTTIVISYNRSPVRNYFRWLWWRK